MVESSCGIWCSRQKCKCIEWGFDCKGGVFFGEMHGDYGERIEQCKKGYSK